MDAVRAGCIRQNAVFIHESGVDVQIVTAFLHAKFQQMLIEGDNFFIVDAVVLQCVPVGHREDGLNIQFRFREFIVNFIDEFAVKAGEVFFRNISTICTRAAITRINTIVSRYSRPSGSRIK